MSVVERKGRGLGKRPSMFNTSIRLPKEVMDYFDTNHPYSKQAMMREVLLDYVRSKTNPQPKEVAQPISQGANHVTTYLSKTEEARPTPKVNEYEGLSEEEIDRLVAANYSRKWTPT
jgi:hypothetical protein